MLGVQHSSTLSTWFVWACADDEVGRLAIKMPVRSCENGSFANNGTPVPENTLVGDGNYFWT